jgi:hypothetical protein
MPVPQNWGRWIFLWTTISLRLCVLPAAVGLCAIKKEKIRRGGLDFYNNIGIKVGLQFLCAFARIKKE